MAATGETERLTPQMPLCPKCAGQMEEGFVPELAHGNRVDLSIWVQGQPEPAFWRGYRVNGRGYRVNDRPSFYLETLRCQRCGYLEFYARRPVEVAYP